MSVKDRDLKKWTRCSFFFPFALLVSCQSSTKENFSETSSATEADACEVKNLYKIREFGANNNNVFGVEAFDPNLNRFAGRDTVIMNPMISVLDLEKPQEGFAQRKFSSGLEPNRSRDDRDSPFIFRPSGNQILMSVDGHFGLYDLSTGKNVKIFGEDSGKPIVKAAFSADGRRVATGDFFGKIAIWEISSSTVISRVSAREAYDCGNSQGNSYDYSISLNADGSQLVVTGLSGSQCSKIDIVDVSSTQVLKSFDVTSDRAIRFASSDKRGNHILAWHSKDRTDSFPGYGLLSFLEVGSQFKSQDISGYSAAKFVFSNDGNFVALEGRGPNSELGLFVIDFRTGSLVKKMVWPFYAAGDFCGDYDLVGFSKDDNSIVTAYSNRPGLRGTVRIWDWR